MNGRELSAADTGLTAMVGVGVTLLGALVLAWWGLSLCSAIAAELLARRGRLNAARRIGAIAPVFMRRAACLALGVNLIAVPSAYAGTGAVPSTSHAEQVHTAQKFGSLSPHWVPVETQQVLEPTWRPTPLPSGGSLMVKESRESRAAADTAQDEVIVQPGDSLWTITARHLSVDASDADVAETWPRWYEANRDVIGENPELLQPGQILHPPTGTPTESE